MFFWGSCGHDVGLVAGDEEEERARRTVHRLLTHSSNSIITHDERCRVSVSYTNATETETTLAQRQLRAGGILAYTCSNDSTA
jgi:hypothetical protein